jgi:two-component system NtrC family sensor kinase
MSIRSVLVAAMLVLALAPAALVGALGVGRIAAGVAAEAQARVNHDLGIVLSAYREELAQLARALERAAPRIGTVPGEGLDDVLASLRRDLDLTVVNLCTGEGRPLAGEPRISGRRIPVDLDPVLSRAGEGRPAWGTVRLEADRLALEGGAALKRAAQLPGDEGGEEGLRRAALMAWAAAPVRDETGQVAALLYGGRLLNHRHGFVDRLRGMVLSEEDYRGKPRGTVTLFLGHLRVATNVLTAEGRRAVGTTVSEAVRRAVLDRGESYTGEAFVVDAWYLSAYAPLSDPHGRIVGMIYVGLLRAPYDDQRRDLIAGFLGSVAAVAIAAVAAAIAIAGRLIRPVRALGRSAAGIAAGDWEAPLKVDRTYAEIAGLASAFTAMRAALKQRDCELRARNEALARANTELEQSNRNYMQTLGFVTHELKAPLAAIQMLIAAVVEGYLGSVPAPVADALVRIRRNCEELQDMVRDYLDLSRIERGELTAKKQRFDLGRRVVGPAVEQTAVFFRSRGITVEALCPAGLEVLGDPELLRVALNNLLTNAAKYGCEGGRARVEAAARGGQIVLAVHNEGEGFPPEEAPRLFDKFYRLKNENTYRKRGSGLGLFTVRTIAELHGGSVCAASEPGAWARFEISIPADDRPPDEKPA